MIFIKIKISDGIRGSVDQHENVRELLKDIDDQFVTSDKALASTLIMKFSSLRLTSVKGVREHIMRMRDTVAQLKKLEEGCSECSAPGRTLIFQPQNQASKSKKSIVLSTLFFES